MRVYRLKGQRVTELTEMMKGSAPFREILREKRGNLEGEKGKNLAVSQASLFLLTRMDAI